MGKHEAALEAIVNAVRFDVPNFASMRGDLAGMAQAIETLLTNSTGWKGEGATAGKAMLSRMSDTYTDIAQLTTDVEQVVSEANGKIDKAWTDFHKLPSTAVPAWVLEAAGTEVTFAGIKFPIAGAPGAIANLLSDQREQAAADALASLDSSLDKKVVQLRNVQAQIDDYADKHGGPTIRPEDGVAPPPPAGDPGGPTGPGPGGGPAVPVATALSGIGLVPTPIYKRPSIDDTMDPKLPTPNTGGTGNPDPKGPVGRPVVPPGTGGGLVPGLGGAAGAAGLAAAARVGGVGGAGGGGIGGAAGGAGAGAGARLGSGLSGTGSTAAGSGSAAGGAGGRGGANNVMSHGGGAGGAGGKEKEKRSGLGGLIAPKLEDDEELGPRSAAADAGGRE